MLQALENAEVIAGYRLRDRIGAGGYGEVWRAEAPGGLAKAVKIVFGRLDERRAACELKALNRIKEVRHPFLLSLERIEVIDGQLIIVTELADSSLKDRYEQCKAAGQPGVPRDEVIAYLRDAADALDFMSAKHGLQHLDIKPENLLIVGGRVKVADFGLVKDLEDASVSLVGGLTPIYAPPEVFDGRPSLHSDQYSLAIVYQEILTGILPFPGRTQAQLAAQHLNSRPRLLPLPAQDRPTIARALAKNPDERFPTCRAMIDSLCQAGAPAARVGGAGVAGPSGGSGNPTDAPSAAWHSTQRAPKPQPSGSGSAPASGPPGLHTVTLGTASPESEPAAGAAAYPQAAAAPPGADSSEPEEALLEPLASLTAAPAVVEDLPAIELEATKPRLRPTLFVGVGGLAACVGQRLHRRLYDRFGDLAAVPAIQILLLDTDPRTAVQATQGDRASALESRETVALPLRKPQEYREDAEKHLLWLSRRWLYNVPRSLQTEGLRPLGRLALIDHAAEVFASLRKAVGVMVAPDALAKSAARTGLEPGDDAVQVFVISSISGGTGSGIVIDLAYAVRTVLAEFHREKHRVHGVLAHCTGRNPSARDVAIANTCACLAELEHFHRAGQYPADPAWRSPPSVTAAPVFDETYLVDVGEGLDDEGFERATDALADYLYLDCVTGGGDFFRKCRELGPAAQSPRPRDLKLRTFGVFRIGFADDRVGAAATSQLAREVLNQWRSGEGPAGAGEVTVDLGPMVSRIRQSINAKLSGDPKTCFQEVLGRCAARHGRGSAAARDVTGAELVEATDAFLGLSKPDEAPADRLPAWLAADLKPRASEQVAEIYKSIVQAASTPHTRIGSARRLARSLADSLRSLESTVRDDLHAAVASLKSLQGALVPDDNSDHDAGEKHHHAAAARRHAPTTDRRWVQYFELRIEEIVFVGALAWLRSLRSRVDAVADQLNGINVELNLLADTLDQSKLSDVVGTESDEPVRPSDALRASVARALGEKLRELTARVDEQCWAAVLARQGGVEGMLRDRSALRIVLRDELHRAARSAVNEALRDIDTSALLLQADREAAQPKRALRELAETATPTLLAAGGARRFVLISPKSPAVKAIQEAFREGMGVSLSTASDERGELALCCEAEGLSLARATVTLLAQWPHCADIASRLHTRRDVAWLPIGSICHAAPSSELAVQSPG